MGFDELTDEQKAKARACETPEEILALAREEGYELTDAELEGVAGGWGGGDCKRLDPHCRDEAQRGGDGEGGGYELNAHYEELEAASGGAPWSSDKQHYVGCCCGNYIQLPSEDAKSITCPKCGTLIVITRQDAP